MDRQHAPFSASAAHRWLNCPGSVRLSVGLDSGDSDAARNGTAAHWLASEVLNGKMLVADALNKAGALAPNGVVLTTDLVRMAVDFAEYVVGEIGSAPRANVRIEQHVSLASVHPDAWGTADVVFFDGWRMHVVDLKTGWVSVPARDNPQLAFYALASLLTNPEWQPDEVVCTIYQPTLGVVDEWRVSADELRCFWALRFAAAIAEASQPDAPCIPGDYCRYCPALLRCDAVAEAATTVLDPHRPVTDLAKALPLATALKAWAKAVEGEALATAVRGEPPAGYKAVAGRSDRYWKDEKAALADIQSATGLDIETLCPRSMVSVAQLESTHGKELIGRLADRIGRGKPGAILVKANDKRAELPPSNLAAELSNMENV